MADQGPPPAESNPWWEGHPDLLPPDPDLRVLHQREYLVRAWKVDGATMMIRGAVMDLKPGQDIARRITAAGGVDGGGPLTIHHMVVDLFVTYPDLVVAGAEVAIEVHPQPSCPSISANYDQLIGLPIARGFTHKVRELFGGPRGCTHTTALLQAMAPVALQCVFSMRGGDDGPDAEWYSGGSRPAMEFMRDTCHVWSGSGELWKTVEAGGSPPMPLFMRSRLTAAGLDGGAVEMDQ